MSEVRIVTDRSGAIVSMLQTLIAAATEETADAFVTEARRKVIDGPKSGRHYGDHQASAPGEPPANETGKLVEAIEHTPVVISGGKVEAVAQVDHTKAHYAEWLEFGTPGGKIAPRPFFHPTVREQELPHIERITQAVRKACE